MFDTLVKKPPIFLPYGVFLAHIFRKFKLDLPFESNVIKVFEPFDKSVLLCMKLFETPLPRPTFPSQSSHRASQSTFNQSTDVLYNSLSAEILDIKARQTSMMESQTSIINNQGLILDRFLNLNIRMDHMDKTQYKRFFIISTPFHPLHHLDLMCKAQAGCDLQCISSRMHGHFF